MDYDDDGPNYMGPAGNAWKKEADRLRKVAEDTLEKVALLEKEIAELKTSVATK